MIVIDFKEKNVDVASGQDQYGTVPAYHCPVNQSLGFGFKLNKKEIEKINETGEIWVSLKTGGNAMQPILLSTDKNEIVKTLTSYIPQECIDIIRQIDQGINHQEPSDQTKALESNGFIIMGKGAAVNWHLTDGGKYLAAFLRTFK